MGIDTSSKLLLGYEYDFLIKNSDEIVVNERLWDGVFDDYYIFECLDSASPYFDAEANGCVWGSDIIESGRYCYCDVDLLDDLPELTNTAMKHLNNVLGKEFVSKYPPKIYLSAHVT